MCKGRRILCQYHGEKLWHERLLLGQVDQLGCVWTIVTPDGDVYIEDYSYITDIKAIRVLPMTGGRPKGVEGKIYPFQTPPTPAQLRTWNAEAKRQADAWVAPIAAEPAPVNAAAKDDQKDGEHQVAPAGGDAVDNVVPVTIPTVAPVTAGHGWYAMEASADGKIPIGACLDGHYSSCLVTETQGVFVLKTGGTVYGRLVKTDHAIAVGLIRQKLEEVRESLEKGENWRRVGDTPRADAPDAKGLAVPAPGPLDGDPLPDARCLTIERRGKQRHRSWDSVANDCTELEMDHWPIDGPRSALWVVLFLARMATGGAEAYHRWWRSITRLSMADWGVSEHFQLCRYLQLAGSYDQLDLGNLAVAEAMARRLQLIEYQYRQRAREAHRGGAQGGAASSTLTGLTVMGGEEADLFDGVGKLDSMVCVAPPLVQWIAGELKKTADIDKSARKAREEKALIQGAYALRQPPLLADLPPDAPAVADQGDKGKGKKKRA